MALTWSSPRRVIIFLSSLVYDVENRTSNHRERVHCSRMAFYSASIEDAAVQPAMLDLANKTECRQEVFDSFIDNGEERDDIQLFLKWNELPDERD